MNTLNTLYRRACKWLGDDDLFVDGRYRLSGKEALDSSERLASLLQDLGVPPSGVVAFLATCSSRHAAGWFGALLGGHVACNLHLRETPQRLGETLRWLGAKALVHDEDQTELAMLAVEAAGIECLRICLGARGAAQASWPDPSNAAKRATDSSCMHVERAGDVAAIILSSGSTGLPKGVVHTQASLAEAAKGGQYSLGAPTRGDVGLLYMQPSFAGWSIIALPLVAAGTKVVFGERFTPASFLDTVETAGVSIAPLVPTMWRMVFAENLEIRDLSSLRLVTIAGEPPAASDIAALRKRVCPHIVSMYLSAEGHMASGVIAFSQDLLRPGKATSTGRPAPGVDVRILNPEGGFGAQMPSGTEGEIAISGPSIAAGYWKDPELTKVRFKNGWWRSGDLGRVDEDGDLWVTGRIDNVINSGGIKVSGEEIERILLAHPSVAQCAVVGVPDARFGRRIEAWIVARDTPPAPSELEVFCRSRPDMSAVKVPKAFHFVTSLPTGPTGKVLRRALRGGA